MVSVIMTRRPAGPRPGTPAVDHLCQHVSIGGRRWPGRSRQTRHRARAAAVECRAAGCGSRHHIQGGM
jgi:hypothetical protein